MAYKTSRVNIGDSLFALLDIHLPSFPERSVIAVTSKIISLCEKSVIYKNAVSLSKYDIIKNNADAVLKPASPNTYNIYLTLKNNILIPSAGIDESNGDNIYILYPVNIQKTAAEIWVYLRKKRKIKNLGILITDSHTTPLRKGVTGIAIGWCGFNALHNYVGKPDLFGQKLRVTKINNLDALAASAVFVMGEGAEQTPLAIITDIDRIKFKQRCPTEKEIKDITISLEQDLYGPIFRNAEWLK